MSSIMDLRLTGWYTGSVFSQKLSIPECLSA